MKILLICINSTIILNISTSLLSTIPLVLQIVIIYKKAYIGIADDLPHGGNLQIEH